MQAPDEYDVLVIGGGPAGLATAIAVASSGYHTVVFENTVLGGQAEMSTGIENYPAFPRVITGADLTGRMAAQGRKFHAVFKVPSLIIRLRRENGLFVACDAAGHQYVGKAVVLACGVHYRMLDSVEGLGELVGRGVTYGSPSLDINYAGRVVYIVGGANSAGQAAHYLAKQGCEVHLLVRGDSIEKGMDDYLVRYLSALQNVTVHTSTQVTAVGGTDSLKWLRLNTNGRSRRVHATCMFVLIGAEPNTAFLDGLVAADDHGFILAGSDLPTQVRSAFAANAGRPPSSHETSVPGLYVAGDVRAGSEKRVVVATGEGTIAGVNAKARLRALN